MLFLRDPVIPGIMPQPFQHSSLASLLPQIKPKFFNMAFKVLCAPPCLSSHPPFILTNHVFYTLAILDYLYFPIILLLQYQIFMSMHSVLDTPGSL